MNFGKRVKKYEKITIEFFFLGYIKAVFHIVHAISIKHKDYHNTK